MQKANTFLSNFKIVVLDEILKVEEDATPVDSIVESIVSTVQITDHDYLNYIG